MASPLIVGDDTTPLTQQPGSPFVSPTGDGGGGGGGALTALWFLVRVAMFLVLLALLIVVVVWVVDKDPRDDRELWHKIRGDLNSTKWEIIDDVCECVWDAAEWVKTSVCEVIWDAVNWLYVQINNLMATYFGTGCILITSAGYQMSVSNRCYIVTNNLVVNGAMPNNAVIYGNGIRHVQLRFDHTEILFNADGPRGVRLINSVDVTIERPACNSPVQRSAARCVQTELSCEKIVIKDLYSNNMGMGASNFNSEMHVSNSRVTGHPLGNGQTTGAIYGYFASDAMYSSVRDSVCLLNYTAQATLNDGITLCFYSQTSAASGFNNGLNQFFLENVVGVATYPVDVHRGRAVNIKGAQCIMDPFSIGGAAAQLPGSSGPFDSSVIEDVSISMQGDNFGADGALIWNARSAVITKLAVTGSSRPIVGFYRGALVHLGIGFIPGGGNSLWNTRAIELKDFSIFALTNNTVSLEVNAGLYGPNISAVVDGGSIDGGLAGVLLANNSASVWVKNVQVANAVYGFAVLNHSNANLFEYNRAVRCCRGFYADNTTQDNDFFNNRASQCGVAYQNDAAPLNNDMAVGKLWTQNIESGTQHANAGCVAPSPKFDPSVQASEDAILPSSSTSGGSLDTRSSLFGGADDGRSLLNQMAVAGIPTTLPSGKQASEYELRALFEQRMYERLYGVEVAA